MTELDTAAIETVWPAPGPEARVRARLILVGEEIIFEDGPTDQIMNTASMRKSFLSLLYGIAVEKGLIDLDKSLAELGIDENPPLTEQEKTATIRGLLTFRSEIYIPAEGEHDSQISERPARDITVVERNFSGNSYLSTGLWMMMNDDDKRSNSFNGAVRARDVLAEMLDAG